MNVSDAAYTTVHEYPGGSESLAPRLGMTAAVLRNKVNPHNDRNRLTLEEADRLIGLTGDTRILQALQANHDALLSSDAGTGNITDLVLDINSAGGDFARTIREALADGVISNREMKDIANAGMASQRVIIALLNRLQGMSGRGG